MPIFKSESVEKRYLVQFYRSRIETLGSLRGLGGKKEFCDERC